MRIRYEELEAGRRDGRSIGSDQDGIQRAEGRDGWLAGWLQEEEGALSPVGKMSGLWILAAGEFQVELFSLQRECKGTRRGNCKSVRFGQAAPREAPVNHGWQAVSLQ